MQTACDVSLPQDSDRAHYWLVTLGPSELNWATLPSPLLCPPSLPCSGSRLASWRSPSDRRRRQTKPSIRQAGCLGLREDHRQGQGLAGLQGWGWHFRSTGGGSWGSWGTTDQYRVRHQHSRHLSLSLSLYWWVIRLIWISSLSCNVTVCSQQHGLTAQHLPSLKNSTVGFVILLRTSSCLMWSVCRH